MRILITGSNGLLGQKLVKLCEKNQLTYLATSKGENRNPNCPLQKYVSMDITNPLEINKIFDSFYPTHLIHTAAITNVDYCEINPQECIESNVTASHYLFETCKRFHTHFNLLSTDFVFDGKNGPYKEEDEVNPLSVYAQSKVSAENLVLQSSYTNWAITRTIIVYGQAFNYSRSNIVLWVYNSLKNQKTINVVNDQYRMPTWAEDLAWACLELAKKSSKGIFHVSGEEFLSMYELAVKIAQFYHLDLNLLKECDSKSLNQPALRPPKTGFILDKIKKEIAYKPTPLKDTLGMFNFEKY
ncbi:MAG: SDR family oxidoreductase [Flavobacteriia bacterium]|nr:SDR family oxidoreductase [Flavobacteriia bacterium]